MDIINPATESPIQSVNPTPPEKLSSITERARIAQRQWQKVPFATKKRCLEKFQTLLSQESVRAATILTQEMGKPITQSRNEIRAVSQRLDFFLSQAEKLISPETVYQEEGIEEILSYEPLGVIANLSAWNYPYFVGLNVIFPALLTSNAVLYKPSEYSTLTGQLIGELLWKAEIPKDLFAVITGGATQGQALLDCNIDGVFFTGSVPTGKAIANKVATKLIPLQLELGGKDPTYVCEDVDIETAAASLADGAFYNTGQSCCAVERIYVHEKVYEPFVDTFVKTVKGFQVGDPTEESTYIGPLARKEQLALLFDQVTDAVEKGAQLLVGGSAMDRTGYYFQPTVLSNTNHSMKLMREESFGPIIGLQKVSSDREAIEQMNDTAFGLAAGIYCQEKQRALRVLSEINSGSAYWNCCDRVSPRLPWSGQKDSGIGVTLSHLGIRSFLRPKALHLVSPK